MIATVRVSNVYNDIVQERRLSDLYDARRDVETMMVSLDRDGS